MFLPANIIISTALTHTCSAWGAHGAQVACLPGPTHTRTHSHILTHNVQTENGPLRGGKGKSTVIMAEACGGDIGVCVCGGGESVCVCVGGGGGSARQ